MKNIIIILIGALITVTQVSDIRNNLDAHQYELQFFEYDETGRLDKPPIIITQDDPTDTYLPERAYQLEIKILPKPDMINTIYNLQRLSGLKKDS